MRKMLGGSLKHKEVYTKPKLCEVSNFRKRKKNVLVCDTCVTGWKELVFEEQQKKKSFTTSEDGGNWEKGDVKGLLH